MKRIHYLLHVPFETPGNIDQLVINSGCTATETRLWETTELPEQNRFDLLIIMGGPMNIYQHDKYPWLDAEKKFIAKTIDAGKTVLGICLGSQLLADVLGSTVIPNRCREIGWYPVHLTGLAANSPAFRNIPVKFTPFHWHGDTYPVPPGAVRIGSSPACDNQGFIFDGNVVGLQFHLEMTRESIRNIIDNCSNELIIDEYVTPAITIDENTEQYIEASQRIMEQFFRNLLEL